MAINKVNFGEFHLNTALTTTATEIKITADNSTYSLELQRQTGNLSAGRITMIDLEDKDKKAVWAFSAVTADGTDDLGRNEYILSVALADDSATYMRALANDDSGTNSVTNVIAGNNIAFKKNSTARIAWDVAEANLQNDTFEAGSDVVSMTAGEAIGIRNAVSKHSDGKIYKYHNVNYPVFYGISVVAIASGSAGNVTRPGGLATGFTGLDETLKAYADNTGQVTQTSTATSVLIGSPDDSTSIRLSLPPDAVTTFLDGQFAVQNTADTTKTMDVDLSGSTTNADTTLAFTSTVDRTITFPDGDFTVADASDIITQTVSAYPNAVSGGGTAGEWIYIDSPATFASATSAQAFGRITTNRVESALPVIGNGVSMSSIDLALRKQGTPTDNCTVRIETDNAGDPSGTLVDANATGVVSGGSLSGSFADTTITFGGAFTPTIATKYWIVFTRSGSQDNTNYFETGYDAVDSYYNYSKFTASWATETKRRGYFSNAAGLYGNALTLTKGDSLDQNEYFGVISTTTAFGVITPVNISKVIAGLTLTDATEYFISDTAGELATTSTYGEQVGLAVSATTLVINKGSHAKYRCNAGSTALTGGQSSQAVTHGLGKRPKKITIYATGASTTAGTNDSQPTFVWSEIAGVAMIGDYSSYVTSGTDVVPNIGGAIAEASVTNTQFTFTDAGTFAAGTLYWSVEG